MFNTSVVRGKGKGFKQLQKSLSQSYPTRSLSLVLWFITDFSSLSFSISSLSFLLPVAACCLSLFASCVPQWMLYN